MKQGELFVILPIPQVNNNPKSNILFNWLLQQADKKVLVISYESN